MDNPLFYTELQGRRENGEETVSLVLTNEEYEEIVSKYGTERKILKTDDDDFERAQKAALPGETLSRAYRSVPKTNGFERAVVIFASFFSLLQHAMFRHKKFRAVINYDAEKFRTEMYIYTPKKSGEDDSQQVDPEN